MTRVLPLYVRAPKASIDGTALAEVMLPNSKIVQHIKEVMEPLQDDVGAALDFVYLVPGHPPMRLEPGHVVFVSFPSSYLLFNCFPDLLILTLRGTVPAEGPHLHGSPDAICKGFIHEGGESRRGRAAEEGKGGQEEEEAAEAIGAGARGGDQQ